MRTLIWCAVGLLCSLTAAGADSDRRYVGEPQTASFGSVPFTPAIVVGDTLYVAGHLGIDAKTGKAPLDAAADAQLVMEAVKKDVEAAGFAMDDLVSVQVYCTDLGLYKTFNDVYRGYFHDHFPARAFVGVSSLLLGGHFEVQAIGVKRKH